MAKLQAWYFTERELRTPWKCRAFLKSEEINVTARTRENVVTEFYDQIEKAEKKIKTIDRKLDETR